MDDFAFPVEILRTNRKKSASIQLDGDTVKVRVPKSLSDARVRELISKRNGWIQTKLKEQAEQAPRQAREFVSGEAYQYLGKSYRLKVVTDPDPDLNTKLIGGYVTVSVPDKTNQQAIKALLESWYCERALARLTVKTERWAKIIGVAPASEAVKRYKARWGSCAISGDISYNWQIIQTPHRIVDYVVVHELCHLLEHNHSPKFWAHVERHMPDWKERRDWLKLNPPIF